MKSKFIKKKVNYLFFLILLSGILFISGCVSQNTGGNVINQSELETAVQPTQGTQGLQIVLKDVGFPEVKYLQPTIKEVQLQDESGKWITIWSNPEGKALKLTPDGAENVLDTVSVEAGTYVATRLLVSTIDVEVDINRDGDTLDKNQQIILTEEEFNKLPQQENPSAPQTNELQPTKPAAPDKPVAPDKPSEPSSDITGEAVASDNPQGEEPSEPSKPEEPSQPPEPTAPSEPETPYRIEGGLVYTGEYLDEKHTATPPFWDGIAEHYGEYLYPVWKNDFLYNGISGKIIYDFTLHPLKPKHEQISVEVSTANPPLENETVVPTETPKNLAPIDDLQETPEIFDVKISSLTCDWTVKTGEYGTKSDCVRIISKGTAQGPIGARVELPILSWSTDIFDCGVWTHKTGALIAVGHTCVRKEGQPETTNWAVDTGGDDCPFKNYFDNERSHSVKIYNNDDLDPQKEDRKNTVCQ